MVARYDAGGTLDRSFDGDGMVIAEGPGALDMVVQPDGRIVVTDGSSLVRYRADGRRDVGFGVLGRVATPGMTGSAMALHPDGRIVLACVAQTDETAPSNIGVNVFHPTGSLDRTFDGDGRAVTSFERLHFVNDVAVQPDGRVVVHGWSIGGERFSAVSGLALSRYVTSRSAPGPGYSLVAADGGVFSFGEAPFLGSTGGLRLARPVLAMVADPDGDGYWLVASDGGVFAYGGARFSGSTGGTALRSPIVGMAADPDGDGYWLVASDGGVFSFGASFLGSTGGIRLARPVVGIAARR